MAYTIKTYTASNNDYVDDATNGANIGIEWSDVQGNQYRVICVNHPTFDYSNRKTCTQFVKWIKQLGGSVWLAIPEHNFTDEISDTSGYRYSSPLDPNFGNIYTNDPFIRDGSGNIISDSTLPWGYKLVAGIQTEAQFFIDNIIKNKNNLNLSIESFLVQAIINHEGLS